MRYLPPCAVLLLSLLIAAPLPAGPGDPPVPPGITSQFQGFEGPVFPPAGWDTVQNDGGSRNWEFTNVNPRSGVAAVRIFYEPTGIPSDDWLITPLVFPRNLPGEDSLIFYFRHQTNPYVDSFEVWVSPELNGRTPAQFLSGGTRIYNNTDNTYLTYQRAAVSLAGFFGQRIYLAWRYDAQDQSRCYLDDITMPDAPPAFVNDVAATVIANPPPGGFIVQGSTFAPAATFRNAGSGDQLSPFNVQFDILDNTQTIAYSNTQSIASLASGVSTTVTFATVPGTLVSGAYTTRAVALLGTDGDRSNDTLTAAATVEPTVAVPYAQDFEGATDEGWTSVSTGGVNQWVRGTPSKPAQIDGPHGGTKCWITRLDSTYAPLHSGALVSPIFDFATLPATYGLVFWQNFAIDPGYDAGVLEYSTDGGAWLRVDSVLGTGPNFTTANSTNWYNSSSTLGAVRPPKWSSYSTGYAGHDSGYVRSITSLAPLAGLPAVKFRWRFVSDATVQYEGWAIDDVEIRQVAFHDIGLAGLRQDPVPAAEPGGDPPARDAGRSAAPPAVAFMLAPGSSCTENAPVTLLAVVRNYGTFIESSYQVGWGVDGVPQTPVGNTAPLAVGDMDTLTVTWPLPTAGLHHLRAWTILPTDSSTANDSSEAIGVFIAPPYTIFEERFNGAFPPSGWTTINRDGGGSTGPWDQGDPTRFVALEGPEAGYAGDEYTTANGLYIDDYLITPNTGTPLDPSAADSLVFFARSYDSPYPDSLEIRLSTTGTDTADFVTLLAYIEVPKTGWTRFAYALPLTPARYIAFRYLIYDGGSSGTNSVYVGLDVVHIVRYGGTNAAVNVSLGPGWNMVSNPVATPADSVRQLFPLSSFDYGFAFVPGAGYQQAYRLEGGKGYWTKMTTGHTQAVSGGVRNSLVIPVEAGWNMIGSLSAAIDTSAAHVSSVPGGIRSSNWFKYRTAPTAGYDVATDLVPGYGYWVKVNTAGTFTLTVAGPPSVPVPADERGPLTALHSLRISDALGNGQTLYFGSDPDGKLPASLFELPPSPPGGSFDARFTDGSMVQTAPEGERGTEHAMAIEASAYPLTITWNMATGGACYELVDPAGVIAPQTMQGMGSLVLPRPTGGLIIRMTEAAEVPAAYSLAPNYPNPFNPATTIAFALPAPATVSLDVFDLLGRHVRTLLQENRDAGYHSLVWDGADAAGRPLGSGTYFLRMSAGGERGARYTATQKMLLMK